MTRHTNNFQFVVVLVSTIMFTSCVNDIPYDTEIGAPKLVLNALLQPDSLLTATVSSTAHFLDYEAPQRLADATVTAVVNGTEIPLTYSTETERYHSTYRLCPEDRVTLTATHTIGTATATAQVTNPRAITITHTTMQPFTNPGDPVSLAVLNKVDSALLVSLHIDDPADENNYYRLTIDYEGSYLAHYPERIYGDTPTIEEDNGTLDSLITEERFYPHYLLTESSSQLIMDSESAAQLFGGLLYLTSSISITFSDQHLRSANGQPIIDFLMLMEYPRGNNSDMYDPESDWSDDDEWIDGNGWDENFIFPADTASRATYHYHFTLETLSEDYYLYLNDVATYSIMGGTFVGEPTPIHTNISGGLGIVGSYGSTGCNANTQYEFKQDR